MFVFQIVGLLLVLLVLAPLLSGRDVVSHQNDR
jgi:hypothetical protein